MGKDGQGWAGIEVSSEGSSEGSREYCREFSRERE